MTKMHHPRVKKLTARQQERLRELQEPIANMVAAKGAKGGKDQFHHRDRREEELERRYRWNLRRLLQKMCEHRNVFVVVDEHHDLRYNNQGEVYIFHVRASERTWLDSTFRIGVSKETTSIFGCTMDSNITLTMQWDPHEPVSKEVARLSKELDTFATIAKRRMDAADRATNELKF